MFVSMYPNLKYKFKPQFFFYAKIGSETNCIDSESEHIMFGANFFWLDVPVKLAS